MTDIKAPPEAADVPTNATILTEAELEKKYPNRPRNTNETFPFHVLYTKLFEPLLDNIKKKGAGPRGNKTLKPHEIRRNVIDQFISKWRSEVGPDIFPAFRLILSDKDKDRDVYGLKEQKIGKLLVKVMKINKDSEDGQALINWKQPGLRSASAGDFALRCYGTVYRFGSPTQQCFLTVSKRSSRSVLCSRPPETLRLPKSTYCSTSFPESEISSLLIPPDSILMIS